MSRRTEEEIARARRPTNSGYDGPADRYDGQNSGYDGPAGYHPTDSYDGPSRYDGPTHEIPRPVPGRPRSG